MEYNKDKQCRCYLAILRLLLEADRPMQINEITDMLASSDWDYDISSDFKMDKKTVASSIRSLAMALRDTGLDRDESPITLSIEPLGVDENGEKVKTRGGFSIGKRPVSYEDVANIANAFGVYEGIDKAEAASIIEKLKKLVDPKVQNKIVSKTPILTKDEEIKTKRIKENLEKMDHADYLGKKIQVTNGKWTFNGKGNVELEPGHKYVLDAWERVANNGNQYLIGKTYIKESYNYEERTFRIDRIYDVKILNKDKDDKVPDFNEERIKMIKKFGMYNGKSMPLKIVFEPRMLNTIVDKFTSDRDSVKSRGDMLLIQVRAPLTDQFFGWMAGLDGKVSIEGIGSKEYEEFCKRKLDNQKGI